MRIAFTFSLRDPELDHTDEHAEYETPETVEAVRRALASRGEVVPVPCDRTLVRSLLRAKPDAVFNIAEGWGGRDRESFVPAIAAALGIPCSGSDATALGITMDKALTKRILRDAGVRTADFVVYREPPDQPPPFGFPAFVKPCCDGSSRGVTRGSLVHDLLSLVERVAFVLRTCGGPAIVEPYLDGREFCVGLLGNDPPLVLPVCEVLLGHIQGVPFFGREYKRLDTDRLDMRPDFPTERLREMETAALAAWDVIGCRDYARIDFRTDTAGVPHLLEVNALPGLSPVSGIFVRQAKAAGIGFETLVHAVFARAERETLKRGKEESS